jgi:hypothetical protein
MDDGSTPSTATFGLTAAGGAGMKKGGIVCIGQVFRTEIGCR